MGWFRKKPPAPPPSKPTREEIIAQARANMRGARERIGEEEIQKMAKALFHKGDDGTRH